MRVSFGVRPTLWCVVYLLIVCTLSVRSSLPAAERASASESGRSRSADASRTESLMPFLNEYCVDCHDGPDGEGGFDLNELKLSDLAGVDEHSQQHAWVRVFDRINDGEMPPPEDYDVDQDAKQQFLQACSNAVERAQLDRYASTGRVRARRMTNDQMQWTLCDLLAIDVPLANLVPDEQRTDGFRNISDAQPMSHYYLGDHLRVVDAALDYAFGRADGSIKESVIDLSAKQIAGKRKGQRNREPEMREGAAVVWSGTISFYGRISTTRVKEAGWYKISLNASSIKSPSDHGLWCSVRSGECVSRAPLMYWVGSFEATEDPQTYEFMAWIEKGHQLEIRPADRTIKTAKFNGGQVGFGEGESQDVPGVAMHSLKLERVFPGGSRQDVSRRLFGDLDFDAGEKKNSLTLHSDSVHRDLQKQLRRFASRAFRRPVDSETMKPYRRVITDGLRDGEDPVVVLRNAYRAVLCSPRFIYFSENVGRLDDFAVANRLSYLLTGKGPDKELSDAARQGLLSDHDEIIAQTRRLLRDENLDHFVNDFTDQWLDLADIAFTEPDRKMYRDFDLVIQNAMLEETRRFVRTAIAENQPARTLVDGRFTWLNNRLARYYGIDVDIRPDAWKRVDLSDHPYRGGLMTHGSVLKVTANGSNTSPVVRGVWICDRLLGVPIPDPPENVPAIEPDIRGAKTVRQILEKHRSQVECASCHARIDPPGFALEQFDAAGNFRDHYLVRKGRSYSKGPVVDAAYQIADGREFDSFVEFRELAASEDRRVAKNFAAKLLVYATGHEPTFADRRPLDEIASRTAADGYRLQSLIEAVVTSKPFLHK